MHTTLSHTESLHNRGHVAQDSARIALTKLRARRARRHTLFLLRSLAMHSLLFVNPACEVAEVRGTPCAEAAPTENDFYWNVAALVVTGFVPTGEVACSPPTPIWPVGEVPNGICPRLKAMRGGRLQVLHGSVLFHAFLVRRTLNRTIASMFRFLFASFIIPLIFMKSLDLARA